MPNKITNYMPITVLLIAWFYSYYQGISTAINVWTVSEIFNHCFLVIPGACFLIYQKREQLAQQAFSANYWLLIPFIGTIILYTFGYVGDIRLLMHIATFVSLPLLIWLVIGNNAAKIIAFPLYFMLFSIPIGEQLIPFLQELTTDLAVPLIEMTGVPIYRNGLYLDIPEGRFLVAEACSGISFLVASIVFGNVYAYISFRTLPKQIFFILISLFVPIIANALRVYGIVLTAHLTDMEYAAGADHLIYGGVFYAIVLFLLIFIGERFRDQSITLHKTTQPNKTKAYEQSKPWQVIATVLILFIMQFSWLSSIEKNKSTVKSTPIINIVPLNNNIQQKKLVKWQPSFPLATETQQGVIWLNKNTSIDFFIAAYASGEGELISSLNQLYDAKRWSLVDTSSITLKDGKQKVSLTQLISPQGEKRMIIHWYQLSNETFTSKIKIKLYQTFNLLLGQVDNSSLVAFSVQSNDSSTQNELLLAEFVEDNKVIIKTVLPSN